VKTQTNQIAAAQAVAIQDAAIQHAVTQIAAIVIRGAAEQVLNAARHLDLFF
jgi:hypothetical protein